MTIAMQDRSDWGCDLDGRDTRRRQVSRRGFLKNGALALIGAGVIPAFLTRSVYAQQQAASQGKRLVVIFQRGAADGLNVVVPYAEKNYYSMRPTIAVQPKEVHDLDGFFGLHPAMATFMPLYGSGQLAVVHAAGSPDTTRSHFDAQDYMESGTPGVKSTPDGWMNRALVNAPEKVRTPFRAVALGAQVPRTLVGKEATVTIANIADFSVAGHGAQESPISQTFREMYDESSDTILHGTGIETFEAVKMLKAANPAQYKPANAAAYPQSAFGNNMRQIAQLLKANLGVEAAFTDIGGWDTHQNQGAATGQLAGRLADFSRSIAAFWQDLGQDAENVTLVTMSEFGRTARQNGTEGTDHGHANVMFVLGGGIKGGQVYGKWPGLAPEQLNEGRDLAVTTDFRCVLGEAIKHSIGAHDLQRVFPGASLQNLLNFTRQS